MDKAREEPRGGESDKSSGDESRAAQGERAPEHFGEKVARRRAQSGSQPELPVAGRHAEREEPVEPEGEERPCRGGDESEKARVEAGPIESTR